MSLSRYLKYDDASHTPGQSLKIDMMSKWIETHWMPAHFDQNLTTLWIPEHCVHNGVLNKFDHDFELPHGFRFSGYRPYTSSAVTRVTSYSYDGSLAYRTGAFLYTFTKQAVLPVTDEEVDEAKALHTSQPETAPEAKDASSSAQEDAPNLPDVVECLVIASFYTDDGDIVSVASVPKEFVSVWTAFSNECDRLSRAVSPTSSVVIIGGRSASFVPTVEWEEVILPATLKDELMDDVQSFFAKGIDVYRRLNLKPFRKLLLAGVPGTGKTMLCSAIAKWALEKEYVVIYISSADQSGATFGKIQYALDVASRSSHPAMIILEELDAYLHDEEKAMVLNVLDGSESSVNDKGTLLIATTNYPEAIDERVLKRPGRLDRIFIIPETREHEDAEKMLKQYIGPMWQDDHKQLVASLVGYPGAFIREVAVYALTQVAYDDLDELTYEMLEESFNGLKAQIAAKDDFLTRRASKTLGYVNGGH